MNSANIHQHGFFLYASPVNIIGDFSLLLRTDYLNIDVLHQQPMIIGVAWSLVVELIFYMLAPFLVRRRLFELMLLLIFSLSMHYVVVHLILLQHRFIPQIFFPPYLVFFLFGICSYRIYSLLKKTSLSIKNMLLIFLCMVFATVFWDKIPTVLPAYKIELKEWLYYLSLVISMPYIFLLFNKSKIDRFIGELSYPVYLSHLLLFEVYQNIFGYKTNAYLQLIIVALFTTTTAVLLVLIVNKPIDNYRQRRLLTKS